MKMRNLLTIILLAAVALPSAAGVTVEARIDSIEMFIGEQAHVTLTVTAGDRANVSLPAFGEQQPVTPGVEVLDNSEVEKLPLDGGMAAYSRVYTLTSFDGKLYYLPPFAVKVDGKEYKSKSLALKVIDVPVDTVNIDKFYGPMDVQSNPFSWQEWSRPFWLGVIMLLLVAAGCYLYVRLRTGKPVIAQIKVVKRLLPHQKAMKEIERIKEDKMAQSENQKEYYTRLTETLRKYIWERYGFNAMEMTSGEIIERLAATADGSSLDELRELFRTADLVKFAKYSTLINENDMNLVNAIEFINSTKLENMPTEEVVRPRLTTEEVRTVKTRRTLKIVIWAVAAASVAILAYVVYAVSQLLM